MTFRMKMTQFALYRITNDRYVDGIFQIVTSNVQVIVIIQKSLIKLIGFQNEFWKLDKNVIPF